MFSVKHINYGNNGPLTVVQLGPEDFPLLEPGSVTQHVPEYNKQNAAAHEVRTDSHFWGHVRTNKQLAKLIREGWPEGASKVATLAAQLADKVPAPVGTRRKLRWAEQGDSIDMTRVYTGQLDRAWRDMPRQRDRAPRIISLDVHVGGNAGYSADKLFWSGATAVALTDALEYAGYRVELFASFGANHWSRGYTLTRTRIKSAGESLNVVGVAALTALPATFRYYGLQSSNFASFRVGSDFGSHYQITSLLDHAARAGVVDASEYVIESAYSEEDALARCNAAIDLLTAEQDAGQGTMF